MTDSITTPALFRRGRRAAATMVLGTACSSTYDIAGGFVTPQSGTGNHTIVYWNLLSGGDGSHMQQMEATYQHETRTSPWTRRC